MQHHNGNAKLNPQRVLEMRQLRAEGWSYPRLAQTFGVSENTVAKTCRGTAWRNVTGGQEILTDGEVQLRQLSTPGPTQEEIEASKARLMKLLADPEADHKADIPEQYRGLDTRDPEAYRQEILRMIAQGKERTQHNGPPPEPVKVRYPAKDADTANANVGTINAEKLLETLKDEHQTLTNNRGDSSTVAADQPSDATRSDTRTDLSGD